MLVGIQAASTVPGATNADKRAVVLSEVTGITDAVSQASGNPEVAAVGMMIDLGASVFNSLMAKQAAAVPAAPAATAQIAQVAASNPAANNPILTPAKV